ncbi:hypothetical protein PLICRDRAFT_422454 [Plicaturopsis crispa FD-325 SS-3]|nr:hypothetical protein PLICRDRAFT_422454 [Plicaturopsis crispa FD-325 SS-3]
MGGHINTAKDIRWNAWGIPYIVEFANVSIRSFRSWSPKPIAHPPSRPTRPRSHTVPMDRHSEARRYVPAHAESTTSLSSWTAVGSSRSSLISDSDSYASSSWSDSTVVAEPSPAPRVAVEQAPVPSEGRGLFLQFSTPSELSLDASASAPIPPPKSAASASTSSLGVHSTSRGIVSTPRGASSRTVCRLRSIIENAMLETGMDITTSELPDPSRSKKEQGAALLKGTYGQVMSAFKMAGLTTTPCAEGGFETATRLGVIFVPRRDECGAVELWKMTLWG